MTDVPISRDAHDLACFVLGACAAATIMMLVFGMIRSQANDDLVDYHRTHVCYPVSTKPVEAAHG